MGMLLANQTEAHVRHVVEFKENLRVLLISGLFIVLAARLELESFRQLPIAGSIGFLLVLLFIVRPAAVMCSSFGTALSTSERLFLSWMAPRGIVAAAVAAIFALRLEEQGMVGASELVPMTFLVIVGTVSVYGLTSGFLARRLKISNPNPQGILFVGAYELVRDIACSLHEEGVSVLLIDNNHENVADARMVGLPVHYGSVLSEHAVDELELAGIGRVVAMTPNSEVNTLASLHFSEVFGRAGVFQLPPCHHEKNPRKALAEALQGRRLFSEDASFDHLNRLLRRKATVKKTKLTESFSLQDFHRLYVDGCLPMFAVTESGSVEVAQAGSSFRPGTGSKVIALVVPGTDPSEKIIENS